VTDRLRILVVNWLDRENPQSGGAETHLHEVFGRLAARGHQVTALVSGWAGCAPRAQLDGIDVHRAGRRYTFSLAGPRYYRRHLAEPGFDVVVEDLNKVPLFTPWWTDAPVVLLCHHLFGATAFHAGPPPLAAATWLLERPIPKVYRNVPTVAVSESTRADLIARGLPSERVEVVTNGIDVERYTPDPAGRRADRPTLLYMGRLKKYKRVDLVIEAVARLAESGIDVRLLVGGTGDEAEELHDLAGLLGVVDRVGFLGYVSEEDKLELMRTSWLHVLASEKEGWGISNLEAAACGTPSVAADAPGLRESVVDGRTGVLVAPDDADALAAGIRTLIDDRRLRETMGREARRFSERFTWDAAADAFEALLSRVVGARTPR
jgi:glycosyltransferase involved in cell wall biosynthesis